MKNKYLLMIVSTFMLVNTAFSQSDYKSKLIFQSLFSGGSTSVIYNAKTYTSIANNATLVTDRNGNTSSSYSFNGSNAIVYEMPSSFLTDLNNVITFWIKPENATSNQKILAKAEKVGDAFPGVIIGINDHKIYAEVITSDGTKAVNLGQKLIADNEWTFVAIAISGVEGLTGYINGEKDVFVSLTNTGNPRKNDANFFIGGWNWTKSQTTPMYGFKGCIDDINIYDFGIFYARYPARNPVIKEIFNNEKANSSADVTEDKTIDELFLSGNNDFKTVTINTQTWTVLNLDVSTFRNGDIIPEAKTVAEWQAAGDAGKPAWCFYNNDPANGKKYGKLYNWYAVNDPRGLAPIGWHVPDIWEWNTLIDFYGGKEVAGTKLKSTSGWEEDGNGTNESGFSALPGDSRDEECVFGGAEYLGYYGLWWSTTDIKDFNGNFSAKNIELSGGSKVFTGSAFMSEGLSVRLVKD